MPDLPNNSDPTQSVPPTDSNPGIVPAADPQKMIDEALVTPNAAPVEPLADATPEPIAIIPESKPEEVVPPELVNPTPTEPMVATEPQPMTVNEVTPPVAETPVMPTEPTPTPAAEEMPLAFAAPLPSTEPKLDIAAPANPEPIVPAEPPVFTPPPPAPMAPPMPEKKKKGKAGKILAAVVGMFLLVGGIVGGFYYYNVQQARIAAVQDYTKDQCNGCQNGGRLVWRNGRCYVTGVCDGDGGPTPSQIVSCTLKDNVNVVQCGKFGDCGGFCITTTTMTCNQMLERECGQSPISGASCTLTAGTAGFTKSCNCGGKTVYFNRDGICNSGDAGGTKDPSYYDTYGLCAVYNNAGTCGDTSDGTKAPDGTSCWTWTASGVTIKNEGDCRAKCDAVKHVCDSSQDLSGGCQVSNPAVGDSQTFAASCGKTVQIDITCDESNYLEHRSQAQPVCASNPPNSPNPSPSPSPSPSRSPSPSPSASPAPTLVCTGLTKNVADAEIKVGTQLQFTCTGSSTPANAVNLNYRFRIRRDSGAWQSLNAQGNKANYTVQQLGDYDVQCRACGTINNANVCDPNWQGATQ